MLVCVFAGPTVRLRPSYLAMHTAWILSALQNGTSTTLSLSEYADAFGYGADGAQALHEFVKSNCLACRWRGQTLIVIGSLYVRRHDTMPGVGQRNFALILRSFINRLFSLRATCYRR
jgi:hypothetical protein